MKISFDFDGCLSKPKVQKYAKELVNKGIDVHIVTRRYENTAMYTKRDIINFGILNLIDEHNDLFRIAEEVGIKKENIHFMNMANKELFFIENSDFIWHLDDVHKEIEEINASTNTIGISVYCNYRNKCNKLINGK